MPINNNPFSYKGRIRRLSFAISVIILKLVTCFSLLVMKLYYQFITAGVQGEGYIILFYLAAALLVFTTILVFFSTIKRLRDVKQSTWWSLLILLGPVYIILFIYLVIVPSKWADGNQQVIQ